MVIKAILRNGHIQPLEPIPTAWPEGQELFVEQPDSIADEPAAQEWVREMEATAAEIPREDQERFLQAIAQIEKESKDAVRREWGLD